MRIFLGIIEHIINIFQIKEDQKYCKIKKDLSLEPAQVNHEETRDFGLTREM